MILSTPLPTILNFDLEAISAPLIRCLRSPAPEPIPSPDPEPDPEPDLDLLFLRHLRAKSAIR